VGQLNATIGESFEYTIPREVLANGDENLSIDLFSLSRYLQFDAAKSSITGTITDDFAPQKVQCTLTVISSDGTQSDMQSFQILVTNGTANTRPPDSPVGNSTATGANDKNQAAEQLELSSAPLWAQFAAYCCLFFLLSAGAEENSARSI
jgi:axial budding pattern protein 2